MATFQYLSSFHFYVPISLTIMIPREFTTKEPLTPINTLTTAERRFTTKGFLSKAL